MKMKKREAEEMQPVRVRTRTARGVKSTYMVDIAQEFHDLKTAIAANNSRIQELSKNIDQQNGLFERELCRLNQNMETVLKQIADHESRLTMLETSKTKQDTEKETTREISKFWLGILGWVFKGGILIGGSTLGITILKYMGFVQ